MSYKEYKGNIFKEDTLLSNEYIIDKLYELDYCNEEIKRLQKENKKLKLCLGIVSPSRVLLEGKYWEKDDNEENKRLHSIIKEVREYIGSKEHYEDDFDTEIKKVYKILDKENKND